MTPEPEVDRDIRTLDHWRRKLLSFPRAIECVDMCLMGSDSEGDIFTGPGRIEIRSNTEIRFFMHGSTHDAGRAMRKMRAAKENFYDTCAQFRLLATDYRGIEWVGGWTKIDFFCDHNRGWPLSGEISSLSTHATGPWVSDCSSVELLFVPPIRLPTTESLCSDFRMGDRTVLTQAGPGRHSLSVFGTTVDISYEPSGEALWVTARTSHQLRHPYAENWLAEPFRILLGGPVYPRMVSRNHGDGSADVWLRSSPRFTSPSAIGLLHPSRAEHDHCLSFWRLYADILTFIANTGDFEANLLTAYYDELARAQSGTRWILTLTLASTVEALAVGLMNEKDRQSEFSPKLLTSMRTHICEWKEDDALRQRILSNLGLLKKRSVIKFMREMGAAGVVDAAHVQTWYDIRNSVMHGNLVEPWSSEEGDRHMNEMLTLAHRLTLARIAKGK